MNSLKQRSPCMPELPEVETVKRGLETVLTNAKIHRVILNRPDLRIPFPERLSEKLEQQTITNLRRRGKYILIDTSNDQTLVCHLGMSGSFAINPIDTKIHDHMVIETNKGCVIYNDPRRFGMIFLVHTGEEDKHPAFATMGPEPLGNDFNGNMLLHKIQHKNTAIKTALLDQNIVAGIGNIYACEALYISSISPFRSCKDITISEMENLVTAIKAVLNEAIEAGGSSLRDHKKTDGTMGYFQHSFKVYNKVGHTCPETGGKIERITQNGRSTFYCSLKQI